MTDFTLTVDINGVPLDPDGWQNALDLAADQGERVWVANEQGKRLAALVPVDDAEDTERRHEEFMASMRSLVSVGRHAAAEPGEGETP
jgi:hypothetical protein